MPISGLVVSLAREPQARKEAIELIQSERRIEVGVIEFHRMAIVIDTSNEEEDKQLWGWLTSLPGVVFVNVAMVAFDDDEAHAASNRTSQPVPLA